MIVAEKNLKPGDFVYAWYSYKPEKDQKRHSEVEYRIGEISKDRIKLESTSGNYSIIFSKELIENWFGNVRKAK